MKFDESIVQMDFMSSDLGLNSEISVYFSQSKMNKPGGSLLRQARTSSYNSFS